MNWYVAQVMTGKEIDIKSQMQKHVKAIVPQYLLKERKRGIWKTVVKILFPGYVFICTDVFDVDIYYKLKPIPGIIKFLGDPSPLLDTEINILLRLCNDDPLGVSKAFKEGNRVTVIEGPLHGLEGQIVKVDARRYRAKVNINFFGEPRLVEMAIDVIKKS